ncbi:hypothetical protein EG329_006084 [Mollisiaceae sp. DMI_Dod_QoI]|nr:hypothetical protein EG329_006084 [Helotiales sp. DMI_Dod_QoI]
MKSPLVLLAFLVASTLGGVLAPASLPTIAIRDALPTCTWMPTTQDPGTCSADVPTMYTTASPAVTSAPADPDVACSYHAPEPEQGIEEPFCVCTSGQSTETAPLLTIASPTIYSQSCEYSTWPGATTSIPTDLPPPTTNTKACMVCTPYAINEDNCNTIPNCMPQIAVATLTVGSAPVHVGTLTGAALYTSVSNALESLCPPVTQTTTSTQCSETGEADIGGIQYIDIDESLNTGSLVVKVPTSGYNITSIRDAMIASISLSIQTSATGSNCFNVTYTVEELKRRDGLMGLVDEALRVSRNLLGSRDHEYLNLRDRPYPTTKHMTMCNGAYFHTANYYDPFWRTAPQPGPTDFMNALFTFEASNSDQFLCEFLDMLVDGLTVLAPDFAVEDVELEEGIDALCCLEDGGCQLEN